MLSEHEIRKILEENSEFEQYFVVDVKVSADNKILVKVDTDSGITIDQCGIISTKLNEILDNDTINYELEVSSPGLTEPLKLPRQYIKNIGNSVDIVLTDGQKITGTIVTADQQTVTIKQIVTEKKDGKKTKTEIENTINFNSIKTTKLKLTF